MYSSIQRREFIKNSALASVGIALGRLPLMKTSLSKKGNRIGIIGLDTSHVMKFTKAFNQEKISGNSNYRVVAAYPRGSGTDIKSAHERIPEYTKGVKGLGVEIVNSISDLLKQVDFVLLETNDGRMHLEQAIPVLMSGKPMFIDKPIAASLADAIIIFQLAEHYQVPVFSSSALRFIPSVQTVSNGKIGEILGVDIFGPCPIQAGIPDFFWYGVHGVEMLYTVMGTGCKEVVRVHSDGTDLAVGTWEDGRIGTFRGARTGVYRFGGTAYGKNGDMTLGTSDGYNSLLKAIINFFNSGVPPVKAEETLAICAFMEAADESRLIGGGNVSVEEIWVRGRKEAYEKMEALKLI